MAIPGVTNDRLKPELPAKPPESRRTKIIVTVGPASESEQRIENLLRAGADAVRLNMAHATHDWTSRMVGAIRAAARRAGKDIPIIMDIKGPEIRTGALAKPVDLQAGQLLDFTVAPGVAAQAGIPLVEVNYPGLLRDLGVGARVLVDNGLIRLVVLEKDSQRLRCRVEMPGMLGSKRHINLPGVRVDMPALTKKDHEDTLLAFQLGIDYLALSFVREAADIEQLRRLVDDHGVSVRIIAKIEDRSAINNLESIVRACDVLMVARGDLGIECPCEDLPVLQRQAIALCRLHGRPVIIATHLLESMITQPLPTRAEISDVATAVYGKVDCIMLSGETAMGSFPVECVEMLARVARRIELAAGPSREATTLVATDRMKVLRSAVALADEMPGSKLLTFSRQGTMPLGLAALRPCWAPILAVTSSAELGRRLGLVHGVEPVFVPRESEPQTRVADAIQVLREQGRVVSGDRLIVATEIAGPDGLVESIQLRIIA